MSVIRRVLYWRVYCTAVFSVLVFCAVQLLEACVKNCGQRFHQELGKFRFLNELIRMLSPKVCALL